MTESVYTKKACAYVRVSTDRQEELSPDAQKRLITDYCRKNSIEIKDENIFVENGISGKKAEKRPLFQHMIALAKSGEHPFDMILVWKFSRFARNQEESIVYKTMLRRAGVEVVSISEPSVEGPFGSLIERIIEWMDEYYSIRLSGEVMRGMTEKALRGGYQSAMPMGYRMNKATGIPEIYEPEAQIIRLIFDSFINSGKSFLEIARTLNSAGFRTRRGLPFERRSVMYILQNPFYCGIVRWNRQSREKHTPKAPSEWINAPGEHPPIINKEDYECVQQIIASRARPHKSKGTSGIKHWLSGIIKCSDCGKSLAANSAWKGRPASFQCSGYNKGVCPHSHFIKTSILEHAIYQGFEQIIPSESLVFKPIRFNEAFNTASNLKRLSAQLNEKERRIKQAYLDGIDTPDEYRDNKAALAKEQAELENLIKEHCDDAVCDVHAKKPAEVHDVYEIITDDSLGKLIRSNAIRSVVDRCVYNKEKDLLEIYFRLDS